MGLLEGRVGVITGAGSGMGKEAVRIFVREGGKVVAADVSGGEKHTADEVGSGVLPVHCDVGKEADVAAMFEAAKSEFGRVDAVFNVAGVPGTSLIHELDMDDYDAMLDVNLRGVMLGIKYGVRAMLERGGSIVNWSSIGGLLGYPMGGVYCASKGAVNGVTRAAAVDYARMGIRVNALCPGIVVTRMGADTLEEAPRMAERPPIGRAAQPAEVAEVAVFLASDRASYLTGAIIPVDGGWSSAVGL